MAIGDLSFAFSPDRGETPETVAKKRMLAEAIIGRNLRTPKDVGEGLHAIGNAIMARKLMGETGKAESEGRSGAAKVFESMLGGSQFPAAPASPEVGMGAAASAPKADPNVGSTIDFARAEEAAPPVDLSGDKEAFVASLMPAAMEASKRTGVDPRIIVAQAAQETGWGKSAPGNNYFGIKSHGKGGGQTFATHEVIDGKRVKMNDSFRQFASPGDSVAGYADFLLENPRYKPMMSAQGLDAQLQALGASGYATDPNYAQSVGSIARGIPMPAVASNEAMAGGAQVASLDPSIGMPPAQAIPAGLAAAAAEQGLPADNPGIAALARLQEQEAAPQQAGISFTPPMPAPAPMPPMAPAGPAMPPAGPVPAQQKVAQAMMGDAGPWGANPVQADAAARGGPSIQQLIQAASDPWMSDGQQAVLNSMIEKQLQSNDPAAQLQRRKLELELKNLENPKPEADWSKLDDNSLFNQRTGETKDIVAPGGTGEFRFEGSSVEAQSLNGLMDSGQITPEQAQQLGAGKTITNPADGSMMFLTPQGVFGQTGGGGTPQPISPPTLGAPAEVPVSPETVPPGEAGPEIPLREGVIPLTPGKANMPTDTQRNRKASVNQAFDVLTGELDRYAELVGQTGIEAAPGEAKDNLNAVRQGVMLQLKELFNLGVLNGPDLSLMEKMIYDPVVDLSKEGGVANLPDQIFTGLSGGAGKRAENSVAELKRMLGNIKASVGGIRPEKPSKPISEMTDEEIEAELNGR
jgi:flagellum-specific peptidoglycan hydrolase FlgJ